MRLQYETIMRPLAVRFRLDQLNRKAWEAEASESIENWIHSVHSDLFQNLLRAWPYQTYWFASLYVVIEGWEQIGLHDEDVDTLRNTEKREVLRRYRNAVFHFQPNFNDARFTDFLLNHKETYPWAVQLTDAITRFFTKHRQDLTGISVEIQGLDMLILGADPKQTS